MTATKGWFFRFLVVAVVYSLLYGCAPKQVKIADTGDGTRRDVVQYAVSLLGKPYKNGAKGPDSFDCSGFVYYIYQRVRVSVPVMTEGQIKSGVVVSPGDVRPGDLVFFMIQKELHVGMMINKKDFIHSSKSRGVAVNDVDESYWRRRLTGFRSVL